MTVNIIITKVLSKHSNLLKNTIFIQSASNILSIKSSASMKYVQKLPHPQLNLEIFSFSSFYPQFHLLKAGA